MKRLLYALPVLIFGVLAYFLFGSLRGPAPNALPSALINKPVPNTTFPALDAAATGVGPHDLATGKVILVNVFSYTCIPCRLEAPTLAKLAKMPGITMYGFAWKDPPDKARAFLDEVGNPFVRLGQDPDGRLGMDWGVSGWPETFVVDGKGVIRARFSGAITERGAEDGGSWSLEGDILPAIEKARLNM